MNLPPAQPALIWYPVWRRAANSRSSAPAVGPPWPGQFTISIPRWHSDIKLPEYFDDTLIMYEWSRNRFWEVKLDQNGQLLKINRDLLRPFVHSADGRGARTGRCAVRARMGFRFRRRTTRTQSWCESNSSAICRR